VASQLSASQQMPWAAMDAALDTFALVLRERHPGVIALPLRDVGRDEGALAPGAVQVIRPFAAPERLNPAGPISRATSQPSMPTEWAQMGTKSRFSPIPLNDESPATDPKPTD
jgi:hypothetical protein